ncbi:hypothetical protein JAAARDRAFT_104483, partial [Jaapia argillacea MUCL 33604]
PKGKSKSRRPRAQEPSNGALPGVQKLKSQLRQTRRLLAKDNLAADVRVATERRLKSLEGDLAKAEIAKKERTLAVRYHKIKFFERQKVCRKISQTKTRLSEDDLSGSSRKKLQNALKELRVDLNYILYYPRLEKYISLFPPEVRHGEGAAPATDQEANKEDAKTDLKRQELRARTRERMGSGELSSEPELHLGSNHRRPAGDPDARKVGVALGQKKQGKRSKTDESPEEVQQDHFFGEDDDDEEEAE